MKINKYSLKEVLEKELANFKSTLRDTSYDKNNQEYLCKDESTPHVYDFDAYVQERFEYPIPASPDAILIHGKNFYFIEFKNQNPVDINRDKDQLQRKFQAGITILQDLLQGFSARDCQYNFCVVFKNQPRPPYMDSRHIQNSVVKFGLDELNKKSNDFYHRIVTNSVDFYTKEFQGLRCTQEAISPTV